MKTKSLNSFASYAPKVDWVKKFFAKPETFLAEHTLSYAQFSKFKRFLFDAGLVARKKKNVTEFSKLIKKIGWNSPTAWGLILVNLVCNNPQVRWYVENLPVGEGFERKIVEGILQTDGVSVRDSKSIVRAFKRLCEIPLGTELNFGLTFSKNSRLKILQRSKARVDDGRVVLYALYKFSEKLGGRHQFTLTRLLTNSNPAGVSPTKIFGIERDEMHELLNGLSVNYPEFINATFTHDLEKISLSTEKFSSDVLKLF